MLRIAIFGKQNEEFTMKVTRDAEQTIELLSTCTLADVLITSDKNKINDLLKNRFTHFDSSFSDD